MEEKLGENPTSSLRAFAREKDASEKAIRMTAKDLGFKSTPVCKVRLLTTTMRENRLTSRLGDELPQNGGLCQDECQGQGSSSISRHPGRRSRCREAD